MNGNCSTTGCKSPERLPDAAALEQQWKSIDWKKAETEVNPGLLRRPKRRNGTQ